MLDSIEVERIDVPAIVPADVVSRFASLRVNVAAAPSSFIDCGNAFVSFGMLENAIEAYTEGIDRDQTAAPAFLSRGQAILALAISTDAEKGRGDLVSQAIGDFERALDLDEHSREAVLGIGTGLLVCNRFAECAAWIRTRLASLGDKSLEGDLLYVFALCRLFSGDVEQAGEFADRMDRVAGFDTERFFIRGLMSLQTNERVKFVEYRALVDRRESKLATVLSLADEKGLGTFLELARWML